jgi:DNA invertase Pin-like site-specific DNA recombinase
MRIIGEEEQLGSFENQVDYYTEKIAANDTCELVRIYSDDGISGCSTRSRKRCQNMIEDCKNGMIEMSLPKE